MSPASAPVAVAGPRAAAVVGVDAGSRDLRAADALARTLTALLQGSGSGAVVATHLTRLGELPHVTLSVDAAGRAADEVADQVAAALPQATVCWVGAADLEVRTGAGPAAAAAAAAGARAHAARTGGRAVHFPGSELLVGALTVGELLDSCAVQAVRVLGTAEPPGPDVVLNTRDHVRPAYDRGLLVLAAEWAAGRTLVPFESPTPTPCCADHA